MNQHLHVGRTLGRLDLAVLQRHLVVCVAVTGPLQMEALGLGAGRTNRRVGYRVGKAAEVNGEALGSDLALFRGTECADSAAGGALQQSHCAAFFYGLHSRFQRFKSCAVVDFGHFFCRKHSRRQQSQRQNQRRQNACDFFHHFSSFLTISCNFLQFIWEKRILQNNFLSSFSCIVHYITLYWKCHHFFRN